MVVDELRGSDVVGRAVSDLRARALRLLARREHSRAELARKLSGPEVDAAELDAVLDELTRRGWLSDQRVAEQAVSGARGRYGPRRVLHRLQQQGLTPAALDQAETQLRSDEFASARAVWAKRFGRQPVDLREKAKQARFLAGRGFSAEVIRRILGEDPEG